MTATDLGDMVLLDSNILVYAEQQEQPKHEAARSLRDRALTGDISACISPQVLHEFYAVSTSPRRVTAPLSPQEAAEQIRMYCRSLRLALIFPGPDIMERVLALLATTAVVGPDIHDLHLVATMLENGVKRIYTFNTAHFKSFPGIEALTPPDPAPPPPVPPAPVVPGDP
ncbi:MAG: TA system VapC family ribonuclease toxin [Candidatus Latescibacterota bacterium]